MKKLGRLLLRCFRKFLSCIEGEYKQLRVTIALVMKRGFWETHLTISPSKEWFLSWISTLFHFRILRQKYWHLLNRDQELYVSCPPMVLFLPWHYANPCRLIAHSHMRLTFKAVDIFLFLFLPKVACSFLITCFINFVFFTSHMEIYWLLT